MSDLEFDESGQGSPATPDIPGLTPDAQQTLADLEKDWKRLKNQKARPTGGVEGFTLLNLCMANDEQYIDYRKKTLSLEKRDDNKIYLTFNLITPRVNKLMGRLAAFNAPFKSRPDRKDPQALEDAEVVDRMLVALDEKVDEPSRMRERLYWLLHGGTSFEYVPWVPNASLEPAPQFSDAGELLYKDIQDPDPESQPIPASQVQQLIAQGRPPENFEPFEVVEQVGDVGSEVFGPFNVFIDQSVKSIQDLAPDQWVHIARIKTLGWIKENFGDAAQDVTPQKDLSLISSKINADGVASGGIYLKDLIPLVQGSVDEHDSEMVILVESYQPVSEKYPHGRYVCWIPKQKILHDDENPYGEIPLVDFHFTPVVTSFWTKAYVTPLVSPQRFINKRMSQLGEQANATIYSSLLLGPGLDNDDIPADYPGVVKNGLSDAGNANVARLAPPEIPTWFLESIKQAVQMFNDAAGGADLMEENKFPGQLRGPMAVPMLQEILDTQWGPLFTHLGERLGKVKQLRLNRVKQFYPPMRTMHYTDRDQKNEVMTFHTEKVLRSNTNFSITVERGAIMPELRALREARVSERLQGPLAILYQDERTGRLDKSKIAADLQFGDTGREGHESAERKLAMEFVKMLWRAEPVPPVQPFYNHNIHLDELEAAMKTLEFVKASPQVQQGFSQRWQAHSQYLQQQAQQQQAGMQSQMIHSAVAQATQQAAAEAAAQAVHEAMAQAHAQQQQPTNAYVASAQANAGSTPLNGPGAPAPRGKPSPTSTLKRKTIIEEHGEPGKE